MSWGCALEKGVAPLEGGTSADSFKILFPRPVSQKFQGIWGRNFEKLQADSVELNGI